MVFQTLSELSCFDLPHSQGTLLFDPLGVSDLVDVATGARIQFRVFVHPRMLHDRQHRRALCSLLLQQLVAKVNDGKTEPGLHEDLDLSETVHDAVLELFRVFQ